MDIAGSVIVYGAGVSGRGAAEVLAKRGAKVFLYNDDQCCIGNELENLLRATGGGLVCGSGGFFEIIGDAELVVLSPGISAENPLIVLAETEGLEIVSEIEIAYRLYEGHIAAITGTNGKTTTTSIVGAMLERLPVPSAVGGNIGLALSKEVESLSSDSWVAAEISSFQLERVVTFSPDIAVVLNLTPDHLDRHHTMEGYAEAKKKIFTQQGPEQITVLNFDDSEVRSWATESCGQVCFFSRTTELPRGVFIQNGDFVVKWKNKVEHVCRVDEVHLFGGHNEENILAAIACGYFAGVGCRDMADVLKNFRAVEHRLEYVRTVGGVPYYNDSKATNTDAVIKALESFKDGHIVLLAGGHDKMTELAPMMEIVRDKVDLLILLGEAKERFCRAARAAGVKNIFLADSFEDAVRHAHAEAVPPQAVLLSPACSSYDMFKNYPERGCCFKKIVQSL